MMRALLTKEQDAEITNAFSAHDRREAAYWITASAKGKTVPAWGQALIDAVARGEIVPDYSEASQWAL